MIHVVYETETADPDDLLALAFLAHHPQLNLRSVIVTPGYQPQVTIVMQALRVLGKKVPILVPTRPKNMTENQKRGSVNPFWHNALEGLPDTYCDVPILYGTDCYQCTLATGSVVITGCPPKGFWTFAEPNTARIPHWIAQGGFAGTNIVEPQHVLPKFAGKVTCPTWNFGGAPKQVEKLLKLPSIDKITCVSKNVCHGVYYDHTAHKRLEPNQDKNLGLKLIYHAMDKYFLKYDHGKLMHDPLACTIAVDRSICEFKQVEVYREKGEWGARPKEDSNTEISVSVDLEKFWKTYFMES